MRCMASRMAARSTTAGTPVKSCSSTRAGMNAISFSVAPAALEGPACQGANIFGKNKPAVLVAQQIFQQDFQRKGQPRNIADSGALQHAQAVNFVGIVASAQRGSRAKRIFLCGAHAGINSPLIGTTILAHYRPGSGANFRCGPR